MNDWIDVNDKMPEERTRVLTSCLFPHNHHKHLILAYSEPRGNPGGEPFGGWLDDNYNQYYEVTHWQPLPEHPKVEEKPHSAAYYKDIWP